MSPDGSSDWNGPLPLCEAKRKGVSLRAADDLDASFSATGTNVDSDSKAPFSGSQPEVAVHSR